MGKATERLRLTDAPGAPVTRAEWQAVEQAQAEMVGALVFRVRQMERQLSTLIDMRPITLVRILLDGATLATHGHQGEAEAEQFVAFMNEKLADAANEAERRNKAPGSNPIHTAASVAFEVICANDAPVEDALRRLGQIADDRTAAQTLALQVRYERIAGVVPIR